MEQQKIQQILDEYYQGNNQTVEALFRLFGEHLIAFANALLRDSDRAKDAVQDVMIKLMETPPEDRREKFRPNPDNVFGALKMRVRNRSIDLIRQRVRYNEADIETVFSLDGNDTQSENFILNDELSIAVRVLEPLEQTVLDYHLSGYSNTELEEMLPLDASARVVKQRIKRKLKREILRLRTQN